MDKDLDIVKIEFIEFQYSVPPSIFVRYCNPKTVRIARISEPQWQNSSGKIKI